MELLSPAGNLEKLRTVYLFGADAAYIGIRNFSLRQKSDNFHHEEYDEIKKIKGCKKLYGALALGKSLNERGLYVTWQFTEENGQHDYYWGHYTADGEAANMDYESRVADYQRRYRLTEKVTPKSIFDRMKEGAQQAAKDNAARPISPKKPEQDRS